MSKYIVKRNFAKQSGMLYTGMILTDIPEPYLSAYLESGFIALFDGVEADKKPASITTGKPKMVRQTEGKPPKNTKKK